VNETRARFCANCGLNLLIAARPVIAKAPARPRARRGSWLVLLLVSICILISGLASVFRMSAPRPVAVPPLRQFYEPAAEDSAEPAQPPPSPNRTPYRQHSRRVWHDQD
jgi:hypothetical protein